MRWAFALIRLKKSSCFRFFLTYLKSSCELSTNRKDDIIKAPIPKTMIKIKVSITI